MGWSIPGGEIRHTGCDVGYIPKVWWCDPCAPSPKRFYVDGAEYPWYAIITPQDDAAAIRAKMDASSKAEQLRARMCELQAQLRDLGGR